MHFCWHKEGDMCCVSVCVSGMISATNKKVDNWLPIDILSEQVSWWLHFTTWFDNWKRSEWKSLVETLIDLSMRRPRSRSSSVSWWRQSLWDTFSGVNTEHRSTHWHATVDSLAIGIVLNLTLTKGRSQGGMNNDEFVSKRIMTSLQYQHLSQQIHSVTYLL